VHGWWGRAISILIVVGTSWLGCAVGFGGLQVGRIHALSVLNRVGLVGSVFGG